MEEYNYLNGEENTNDNFIEKGKGRLVINDNFIGKNIKIINAKEHLFEDAYGNKYKKHKNNLFVLYYCNEGENNVLAIEGFVEGDYGLWLTEKAPYIIEDNFIVNSFSGKKAEISDVLALEENNWLEEDERIKDDFLWIYPREELVFPEDDIDDKSSNKETEDSSDNGYDSDNSVSNQKGQDNSNSSMNANEKKKQFELEENSLQAKDIGKNGQLYVCDGAILRCSKGTAPCRFNVIPKDKVFIKGKAMATIKDNTIANIPTFATCMRKYSPPCTPNLIGTWQKGKTDVLISNTPALLEKSNIRCTFGGTIKVQNPGQNLLKE
ncbi:DUF4280 domain-containing protein [Natronospora cellulosivora (SeqCode)]